MAVLVDNGHGGERLQQLAIRSAYVRWVSSELVPWIRRRWSVSHDPHRAVIMGSSAGGLAAARVAFEHPELFGNVVSQSGAFWRGDEGSNGGPYEWLTRQIEPFPRRISASCSTSADSKRSDPSAGPRAIHRR